MLKANRQKVSAQSDSLALLLLYTVTLYLSYRYPLQINSSVTSPTYVDTPISLQLGKYVLILFFALSTILFSSGHLGRAHRITKFGAHGALSLVLMMWGSVTLVAGFSIDVIEFIFLWGMSLIFGVFLAPPHTGKIEKFLKVVGMISVVTSLVQIALFIAVGRLPALAYAGSLSVRFGSFLDDPNGFALLCLFFLYYFKNDQSIIGRVIFFCHIPLIFLTQSLTIIIISILFLGFYLLWSLAYKPHIAYLALVAVGFFVTLLLEFFPIETLLILYEEKYQSIVGHLAAYEFNVSSASDLLFGVDSPARTESFWVNSFYRFGMIWTFLFAALQLLAMRKAFALWNSCRGSSSGEERLYGALLIYFIAFFMATFNIDYFSVFPNNFLYFLFSAFVVYGRQFVTPSVVLR
jgi:hypothetical protein